MQIDLEAERKEILNRYKLLIKACKRRLEKGDKEMVRKAFEVAVEAHKEMRRKSGEPYIYHPIAVATICVLYCTIRLKTPILPWKIFAVYLARRSLRSLMD